MKKRFKSRYTMIIGGFCILCLLIVGIGKFRSKPETYQSKSTVGLSTAVEPITTKESLVKAIQAYFDETNLDMHDVSISIRSVDGSFDYGFQADQSRIAASVYKFPLAVIWYERINDNRISLSDTLTYSQGMYEEGGPIGDTYEYGAQIPLEELLYDMIVYSDNTAGHILFESLGGWNDFVSIAADYSSHSLPQECYEGENLMTANFMADVASYVYSNKENFAPLISFLKQSMPENYLNLTIQCDAAQKYGSYGSSTNVVGFVEAKNPYVISIFTEYGEYGEQVIGDINEICYRYFNND